MKYDLLVFDMDGTILDTLEDLKNSMNHTLRLHNMPERTLDEIRSFVGNGIRRLIELAVVPGTSADEMDAIHRDYMEYYNNERPQWTRNQMTPIEFEQHLLQMDEDGFNIYLANEQIKYDNMRQKAIENAKKRAKDLGAL